MERGFVPQLDPDLFATNLAALHTRDPYLADLLADQSVPPATPSIGRDGSLTFRLPGPNGRHQWFGRTSMPAVSGPALLEKLDCGTGNVALPGIGQGIEARLLAERLAPHRAVFVLEPAPYLLALALRLHRLSEPLQRGKIVLISVHEQPAGPGAGPDAQTDPPEAGVATVDELAGRLTDFLVRFPGYVVPDRLMPWPWMTPADIEPFKEALQRAGRRAVQDRARAYAAIECRLALISSRTDAPPSGWPWAQGTPAPRSVLGLALGPSERVAQRAAAVARASQHTSIHWHHCLADSPAHGQSIVHMEAVVEHEPDVVLAFDHTRAALPSSFPAGLPIITWLDSPALIDDDLARRLGRLDVLCPTSPHLGRQCRPAGVPPEQIRVLAPGACHPIDDEPCVDRSVSPEYRCDVALFADGAELNPAVWGMVLDTHEAIYRAAVDHLRHEGHRFYAHQADLLLDRVEKTLSLTLGDVTVRSVMRRQIEQVIAPTLLHISLIRELKAANLNVHLYGRGWETHEEIQGVLRGRVRDPIEQRLALAGCRLVIHADPTGGLSSYTFDAAAAGRPVLVRSHPYDELEGGLARLFRTGVEILTFTVPREAAALAEQLLAEPEAAVQIAAAARTRVQREHTMVQRLEAIADFAESSRG